MSVDIVGKIIPHPSAYQETLWVIDKKVDQHFGMTLIRNGVTTLLKNAIIASDS